jgi:hypothetical protein
MYHNIVFFSEKIAMFSQKLVKIAENFGHNIDPPEFCRHEADALRGISVVLNMPSMTFRVSSTQNQTLAQSFKQNQM